MSGVTVQFLYHLVANNMVPMMAASVSSMYMNYFSGRNTQTPTLVRSETDDERELDLLQMDRMLKWMSIIFEDSFVPIETPVEDTHKAYKKELYSIYMTIGSDYKQYRQWKQYNNGIWLLSSYRNKDTKALAKKILADVKLFHEGLKMFSMFDKLQN